MYLVYKYENNILKYFTPSAADCALTSPWDKELYCTKSSELEGVGNLLAEVDNIMTFVKQPSKLVEIKTGAKILNYAATTPSNLTTFEFSQDTESVNTFQTHVHQDTTTTTVTPVSNLQASNKPGSHNKDTMSNVSSKGTNGTNGTLGTRVCTMEHNIQSFTAILNKVQGYLRSQHNTHNDQGRHSLLEVVTPPTVLAEGGSAL